MYIFMLTNEIMRARLNIGSTMFICVVSRYNYSIIIIIIIINSLLQTNVHIYVKKIIYIYNTE